MQKDYYIGLDMGTNSVGYAVCDTNYEILKSHGKAQWGVRLFDTAQTAAARRFARTNRRRLERRRQRILLLQEIFAPEIVKIDPSFFQRLNDSFFLPEHKVPEGKDENQTNTLFNDPDYSDKDYHQHYPTIYHLRYDLMNNPARHDVRLVYLALAHILKTRGHFLYSDTGEFKLGEQYQSVFTELSISLSEVLDIDLPETFAQEWRQILTDTTTKNAEKQSLLLKTLDSKDPTCKGLARLLSGYDVNFSAFFNDQYKEAAVTKVNLSKLDEEASGQLETVLTDEHFEFIQTASAYYNLVRLESLLQGADSLSQTKIRIYNKHGQDLRTLKKLFRKHVSKEEYDKFFSTSEKGLNNYVAYSGHFLLRKKKQAVLTKCDHDAFLEQLKKILNKFPETAKKEPLFTEIMAEVEKGTFLPKITDKDNSLIPHQLHHAELKKILQNASAYLPFLNQEGEEGYTKAEMISLISDFRIPYYVGPLNPAHSVQKDPNSSSHHAWVSRLSDEPVRPWNFNRVIDVEQSATDFIANLTNKCTYLIGEDVLPKESPLYAKYSILNLLNSMRIKGERLETGLKQKIFNHFFLEPERKKKATRKNILDFLKAETGLSLTDADIEGIDLEIPGDMKAEKAIERIAPDLLTSQEKENIVRLITVFPDSVQMINSRLTRDLQEKLSPQQISQLARLKFIGWGRLSERFLKGIEAPNEKAEFKTIIDLMWEESLNLQEILSSRYLFQSIVQRINEDLFGSNMSFGYHVVENYPISPPVKRMVWQALRIIKELIKVNHGKLPDKIFLEVAREEGKKERTRSRKQQLLELYKDLKKQEESLYSDLENRSDAELRSKKLFLYFTQMGRCMYSGENISVENLNSIGADGFDLYDIDHIYPRSVTKDDSLLNNLVLVKSSENKAKSDNYPIIPEKRKARIAFWAQLKASGLITEEKFRRLSRQSSLSEEELAGFINRQLVETRQAAKAAANLIKQLLPETQLVYVKAGHVSDFRNRQSDFKFPKVRGMNDLHHAKDAYLNIVIGNVFDSKFTNNPLNFIRNSEKRSYHLAKMYDFTVQSPDGQIAWEPGEEGSIKMVKKMMARNNILVTHQTHHQHSGRNGGIFNQMILPKGQGQFPIKTSDSRLNDQAGIDKYGAYSDETGATFFLVEHKKGKKIVKTIMPLGLGWYLTHPFTEEALMDYCVNDLKLKEPRILIKDIPYNAIIIMDGYPLRILAKSDSRIKVANMIQPIFSPEQGLILKEVFIQCAKESPEEEQSLPEDQSLADAFLSLYDAFIVKLATPPFSNLATYATQVENLKNGRDKFVTLTVKEQAQVLNQVLILMLCDPQICDLSLISPLKNGRPQNTQVGMIRIQQNLPWEDKSISICFQSVTGLFEKRVKVS